MMRGRKALGIGGVACVGLVLLLIALAPPRTGSTAVRAQQGDDPALLRELAERLVAPGVGPNGQPQTAVLLPGQLPGDLPLALPQPPNSRVIGSAVRKTDARATGWDVVLDVPGVSADITTFFQQNLSGVGWNSPPNRGVPGRGGGFQSSALPANSAYFCQSTRGPFLSVTTYAKTGGPNDVRVHIETSNPGPCAATAGQPSLSERIPSLSSPPGVFVQGMGGSGSSTRSTSDATATTEQSAQALETAYAQQLMAAGWTRLAGGAEGPLAWSTWKVPGDGDYEGFLTVRETSAPNRRDLHVDMSSLTDPVGASGATSTAAPAPTVGAARTTTPTVAATPVSATVAPTPTAPPTN